MYKWLLVLRGHVGYSASRPHKWSSQVQQCGLRLGLLDWCVSLVHLRTRVMVGRLVGVGKLNLVPPASLHLCVSCLGGVVCVLRAWAPLLYSWCGWSRIMWLSFGCFVGLLRRRRGRTLCIERTEPQQKVGRFFSDVG